MSTASGAELAVGFDEYSKEPWLASQLNIKLNRRKFGSGMLVNARFFFIRDRGCGSCEKVMNTS